MRCKRITHVVNNGGSNPSQCTIFMKHVKQLGNLDCGVASTAIITNKNYNDVLSLFPNNVESFGLWYAELVHGLCRITEQEWSWFYYPRTLLKDFHINVFPVILLVDRPEGFHYAVWDKGIIYDPLSETELSCSDYKFNNWVVFGFICKI